MIPEDFTQQEQIQDYLDGKLSGEVLASFEQRLQNDNTLKEEVHIAKEMRSLFAPEDEQVTSVRQTLKEIHAGGGLKQPAKVKRLGFRKMGLGVAAAVLLLVSIRFLIPTTSNSDKLYAANAEHPELALTTKSATSENGADQLEQAFKDEKYQSALQLSKTYLAKNPMAYDVLLAQGICQLELGNFDDALETFAQLKQTKDLRINKGSWYTALTYLKMNQIEQCKSELTQIISDQAYHYKEAKALLDKL